MTSLFNLTSQMEQIGKLFTSELKNRMRKQIGVEGSPYKRLTPATIQQKVEETNDSSNADKRMIRWADFKNNAFRSEASTDNVRVFIGHEPHGAHLRSAKKSLRSGKVKNIVKAHQTIHELSSKAVMMDDLAGWQLEAGGAKFFPQSDKEVEGMDSYKKGMKLLEDEAYKQALKNMTLKLNVNLNIG